jgi:hypothetical protein
MLSPKIFYGYLFTFFEANIIVGSLVSKLALFQSLLTYKITWSYIITYFLAVTVSNFMAMLI